MIYSIGIGPGNVELLTPQAMLAIEKSEVIIGYTLYIDLIKDLIQNKHCVDTGMRKEQDRAAMAFEYADEGYTVAVISSGDSGVYGMASLLLEMKFKINSKINIEVIPGISAMFSAAAKLGAPLSHDFCAISLSNLLTPWEVIEKRIVAAASADFVTAVYNPYSNSRFWQIFRLKEIFLKYRSPDTLVGIAKNVERQNESVLTVKLKDLNVNHVDMFTILIIGNKTSKVLNSKLVTPRGYYDNNKDNKDNIGRKIMSKSFKSILTKLDLKNMPVDFLWVALHCIHTTADFSIVDFIEIYNSAIQKLHKAFYSDKPPVIITDVEMVTNGIRKSIIKKLNITVKCFLNDQRAISLAEKKSITRAQAGIQIAVKEYPNAVYVFGNAPTALMELVRYIRNGDAKPIGVVAAPVGFVNVCESKLQLKYGCGQIPYVSIEGNRGGSNIAATIINSILSWDDANQLHPGKGL